MADRTLTRYEEPRHPDGPHWIARIERSAAGQPGLFIVLENNPFEGSPLPRQEMSVVIDDGRAFLQPVFDWLDSAPPVVPVPQLVDDNQQQTLLASYANQSAFYSRYAQQFTPGTLGWNGNMAEAAKYAHLAAGQGSAVR